LIKLHVNWLIIILILAAGGGCSYNEEDDDDVIAGESIVFWETVSAVQTHYLGIKSDGTLWTWGQNTYGQPGDRTNPDSNVPVLVGERIIRSEKRITWCITIRFPKTILCIGGGRFRCPEDLNGG
jgi:alpha-tubulin suppressor-like RCC1 family protein